MNRDSDDQIRMTPVPGANRAAIAGTQAAQRLHRHALPRVRAAALAWRNGMAGLLAALLGFSLIKGRSDISQLAPPWNAAVGVLLLAALIVGAYGALRLLWAAHGRPELLDPRTLGSGMAADSVEAALGTKALLTGIRMSLLCAGLLVAAVALTWYGKPASKPEIQVTIPGQTLCGTIVRIGDGTLTLSAGTTEQTIPLAAATGIRAVGTCVAP